MLEKIREGSQGVWAIAILGLVILSFVFAGVGSYITSSPGAPAAEVNGDEITQQALERAYQNTRARMEAQMGEAFTAAMADASYLAEFRKGVLDRLIADKLLEQTARDLGLRVSDAQVRAAVVNMPEFQIGGEFNNDRFQSLLRQSGFQVNTFRDYMRLEMTRRQVADALSDSGFALPGEATEAFALQGQDRDFRYVTIPSASFAQGVELSDEEINQYYQANLARFDTQEQVSVSYVELKVSDLAADIEVSEDELLQAYDLSKGSYQVPEQRRASHILFEFGEDKEVARAEAEAVLARIRAGEDFAELAASESQDAFSAENGGDLDWFGRDVMDPAFEDAAYAMSEIGQVSDVVESEFGFHIIKLTDISEAAITPFEDVRDQLAENVRTDKATEEFFALQTRMAELAFEVPDTLQDVANELALEIKQTELFDRDSAPQPIASPAALNVAFSQELVADRMNSDVIEVANNHVVVMRVNEHKPERTQSLDEVRDLIVTALQQQKSQQAARSWAESLLASIRSGEDVTAQLDEKGLSWELGEHVNRYSPAPDSALIQQAFKLAPTDEQKYAVVDLNNGNIGVIELTGVHAAQQANDQIIAGLQRQLQSLYNQKSFTNMIEAMRAEADIRIYN